MEKRLEADEGGASLKAALSSAEKRHGESMARLQSELDAERKKLENVQSEYVECKKERNKAESEALEAEEALGALQARVDNAGM